MTLSRWRRVMTGFAAGVIVLCAALLGGSLRDDGSEVSVAVEQRPDNVIPIPEDSDLELPDPSDVAAEPEAEADAEADAETEPEADTEAEADTAPEPETEPEAAEPETEPEAEPEPAAETDTGADAGAAEPAEQAEPAAQELGLGGGVDNAECVLDRLVIYAGVRVGGAAGSVRDALLAAGFGAGCDTPVTVLASNCPLQFDGVFGPDVDYDPMKSYVASSASVDRATMTAVMGAVGYSGNEIDILDFGFGNPAGPDEQWMAVFIPPGLTDWDELATLAGLTPTDRSLCSTSGELAG